MAALLQSNSPDADHKPGLMTTALQALGSLIGRGRARGGADARIVRPWRDDAFRTYPSVGLTPSKALTYLHAADAGQPQMLFELFSEMLQKWPRLAAVEATRRLALTGLRWDVVAGAAARGAGQGKAGAARLRTGRVEQFCCDTLDRLATPLDEVLDHLASAIGHGVALAELVWEDGTLIDITPVPHSRVLSDPHEPWRLRVLTSDEATLGVAIDETPNKWIVHRPKTTAGRALDGGLLRASILLYLAQNLSFKDWLIYSQIAGMPVRVAQFEPGTPEGEKAALLRMLDTLGTDSVAVLSKTVDLKLLDAAKSGERPYQPLQDYCNTEVTILWLGQHLTTDVKASGSRAAAEIHDRVREDLLVDDIRDEAATLRRDLLRPIIAARFGEHAPVPHFRRALSEAVDTKVLAETLAVAVRELGLRVPAEWAYGALGIPAPTDGQELLAIGGAR